MFFVDSSRYVIDNDIAGGVVNYYYFTHYCLHVLCNFRPLNHGISAYEIAADKTESALYKFVFDICGKENHCQYGDNCCGNDCGFAHASGTG